MVCVLTGMMAWMVVVSRRIGLLLLFLAVENRKKAGRLTGSKFGSICEWLKA